MNGTTRSAYIVAGLIRTMDEDRPRAEAFVVADGHIAEVGDLMGVRAAYPDLNVIRHDGAILPGMVDAHNHHAEGGKEDLFHLSFPATAPFEDVLEAVRHHAAALPEGEWVVGGLWGSNVIEQISSVECLAALDAASGGHPVLLTDDSHHNKWANSLAMTLAGIDTMGEDPPGGRIMRDPSGAPTGVLYETAGALVEQHRRSTELTDDAFNARCSERGVELLAEHGIVAFQDAAAGIDTLSGLAALDASGTLKAWVVTSALINDNVFGNAVVGEELMAQAAGYATEHHRPTWTKIFLDGVPSSHNAAFLEPYKADTEHGHDHRGATLMDPTELERWLRTAARYSMGVKVHCTGDASVRAVLDAVQAIRADGVATPVHVAHGPFIDEVDRPRLAALGVVAEISPFLWFPGVIAGALEAVLPAEVFGGIHPNRTLLDLGTHLAVGSDWPVCETPNPWLAVEGLITRKDPTGRFPGTLNAAEAITREEAIAAVTCRGADAIGLGDVTGRIRMGNSADFVFLSQDPFTVSADEISRTHTVATFFAGEQVFGTQVPGVDATI